MVYSNLPNGILASKDQRCEIEDYNSNPPNGILTAKGQNCEIQDYSSLPHDILAS